jgi:hypothetical protein
MVFNYSGEDSSIVLIITLLIEVLMMKYFMLKSEQ